ncbi:MAG TPA: translation initiation factor IF-1 [Candidatus Pacearchaeota archaeon]|nr:translation initiation factor IF-1 [Candidatus Pacearchaeota archaeon]
MKNKSTQREEGTVIESLPSTNFKVKMDDGREVIAHLSGRLRRFHIRILVGDQVSIEVSPYDPSRGRIVYRN